MKKTILLLLLASVAWAEAPKTHVLTADGVKHGLGLIAPEKRAMRSGTFRTIDPWTENAKVDLPEETDLRKLKPNCFVIEDQGQAGNCWAFSGVDALRETECLQNADPGRLSQQMLVDKSARLGYGCGGGYFDAFQFLVSPDGPPSWASYPYNDRRCNGPLLKYTPVESALEFVWVEPRDYNLQYVMEILHAVPSITVAAGTGSWMNPPKSGVFKDCRSGQTDHMINAARVKRNGGAYDAKGNLPYGVGEGTGQNQWGQWGKNGYIDTVLRDSRGNKCNNFAEEIGIFIVKKSPEPPPVPPTPPVPPAPTPGWFCRTFSFFWWCD